MLIKGQEVILSEIAILVRIIGIVYLIDLALAKSTDLANASLVILLALRLAHQASQTVLSEDLSENFFAFFGQAAIWFTETDLVYSHLLVSY